MLCMSESAAVTVAADARERVLAAVGDFVPMMTEAHPGLGPPSFSSVVRCSSLGYSTYHATISQEICH